jgi:hypothetical protein
MHLQLQSEPRTDRHKSVRQGEEVYVRFGGLKQIGYTDVVHRICWIGTILKYVRSEVFTEAVMKCIIF